MDDVGCSGSEGTLTACRHLTSHDCGHHEDAGVRCQPCEFAILYIMTMQQELVVNLHTLLTST